MNFCLKETRNIKLYSQVFFIRKKQSCLITKNELGISDLITVLLLWYYMKKPESINYCIAYYVS